MKSLLKPAIELTEEGVEAAKETASNISTAAKDLFTTLVPKNSKISEEAVALHKMVRDRVDEGTSRRAAFKDISQLTGLTNTELDAKNCCTKIKKSNPRIKHVIYGKDQFKQLTELEEQFLQ